MKKVIFRALFKTNRIYSILWMTVTSKDKEAFREESKVHEIILTIMSGVCE